MRIILFLRAAFLLFCVLSLFGFAVLWAQADPYAFPQRPILRIASIPQYVIDTIRDVRLDPFALSRTPDEFGALTYRPVPNHSGHRIEGLVMRHGPSADRPQPGWRILYGLFHIDGEPRYAALALSPDFAVEHVWPIDRALLDQGQAAFQEAPYPHGFALLPDGSLVAAFDTLYPTVRVDACGRLLWTAGDKLNHALYAAEDGRTLWGVGTDSTVRRVDLATGRVMRTIRAGDIAAANPELSLFDMLRRDDNGLGANARGTQDPFHEEPYHINDAEPLPSALAPAFPQFAAGDLLMSFRSLNLVAVVDPDSLRVKWFTNDYTLRQHDPDWEANGEISVLDNQMGRRFSRIVNFDPATGQRRVAVDGRSVNFYTRIRGKHQSLADGSIAITSSAQGRALEIGRDGRISSEILVRDPTHPGSNFVLSEMQVLPAAPSPLAKVRQCPK
ncbi:MAG: arylsulfotransferase family protein [Sphingobium sp.]